MSSNDMPRPRIPPPVPPKPRLVSRSTAPALNAAPREEGTRPQPRARALAPALPTTPRPPPSISDTYLAPLPRAARAPEPTPGRTLAQRPGPVPHGNSRSAEQWDSPNNTGPSSFYTSNSASSSASSLTAGGGKRARALAAISQVKSSSGFQSAVGGTAAFGSRARSALSTATSLAVGAAGQAAAQVSAAASGTEKPQTWSEWARDWAGRRKAPIHGKEELNLLPGWAVKRPRKDGGEDAFDLHVSTVGFCTFVRDPSSATRTQKTLMSFAKRVAALPAVPASNQVSEVMNEALTDEPEDLQFPVVNDPPAQLDRSSREPREESPSSPMAGGPERPKPPKPPTRTSTSEEAFANPQYLSLAHEYLDSRLRPFWSSVLPFRRVAVNMFAIPLKQGEQPPKPDAELLSQEPLLRTTFTTNGQGHFSHHFVIPWQRICTHPNSVPMAFADDPANDRTDWGLVIHAELLSEEGPDRLIPAVPSDVPDEQRIPRRVSQATSYFSHNEPPNQNDGDGEQEMGLMGLGLSRTAVTSDVVVSISRPGGIRVISDVDDTVKHSDILSGPREVFRNVFCRRLEDIAVPGMSDLYHELHKEGMSSLHYVSNSPFELFPSVTQFFRLNRFPHYYSLKLKFYGGRSIVTSLLESAGDRKRPGIVELMDEFEDSRFILIGDSGEQDLELYTALAQERPHQVAAIFIRDVTSGRVDELRKLTGYVNGMKLDSDSPTLSGASTPRRSAPDSPMGAGRTGLSPDDVDTTMAELQEISASEQKLLKRAAQWEYRVQQAYERTPDSVPLVFFKEPEEIESIAKGIVRDAAKEGLVSPPRPVHKHTDSYMQNLET